LKITIIWYNELFNDKGLKANHIIFAGLFQSNAGKNVIYNFSYLHVIEMNDQTIWITISEMLRKNWEFA
jgi:hypothetical protein